MEESNFNTKIMLSYLSIAVQTTNNRLFQGSYVLL